MDHAIMLTENTAINMNDIAFATGTGTKGFDDLRI